MSESAIEAVGLSKRFPVFGERRTSFKERLVRGRAPDKQFFWALRNATFSVPKGGSLGIIGHNGSGKSTALKVLTGIYRPTSGQVTVNGSVSALLEVGAGFHPELTGRENIRLNATILGFTGRQINAMMDQIVEFADIGDHIDAPIKHYSSGMYVRLGFAVAVMVKPEILIVDEVIAVGDEEFQRKCYDYLYELRRNGTSLVVVSHGLGQINDLCDEAVWLDEGEPRLIGPSRQVTKAYLDSVNAKEAARTTPTSRPGGESREPRRGTGLIRVTGVELLDAAGESSLLTPYDAEVTIRMAYTSTSYVPDVTFTITMETPQGLPVLSISSSEESAWNVDAGSGFVEFAMEECLLAPGSYVLKTAVTSESSVLDADDEGLPFTIRSGPAPVRGLYRQPGRWLRSPALPIGELVQLREGARRTGL